MTLAKKILQKTAYRFNVTNYSIRKLSILGFSFVALPLVLSLIYGATVVNNLSEQSAIAILDVAQLTKANKELQQTRVKMERYASQYIVLADDELLTSFSEESAKLALIIADHLQSKLRPELSKTASLLLEQNKLIALYLTTSSNSALSLTQLQNHFIQLAAVSQKLADLSNTLTAKQAAQIKQSTEQVSRNLLLGLWIIPVAVIIAFIFIRLLTTPLKTLSLQIKKLEQGQSKQSITVKGSTEVQAIAEALDKMRAQLHALELQKSSFIRHISHELKTPLAAIREGTELLYDNSVGELNAAQYEISQIIRTSVNKLQQLIEDLLDFNVVLDSTSLQDTEQMALLPIIDDVLLTRQLDIQRKKLKVEVQINHLELYANAKQLTVIFDNLLSNAIKYSPQAETIYISAEAKQGFVNVTITDHGRGITKETQNKIFDAFYQGPAPEDGNIKSSGLGLTIVKELMMRLNAEISIQSQTEQPSFTKFYLRFPQMNHNKQQQNKDHG